MIQITTFKNHSINAEPIELSEKLVINFVVVQKLLSTGTFLVCNEANKLDVEEDSSEEWFDRRNVIL